ncbi:MAG: ATP-binding protein [Fibrobacteres bacterium]|nr:ATP-binding protein [Fibrobacterota bacterium]
MTDLSSILELDQLARKEAAKFIKKRYLYTTLIEKGGRHFIGIAGPRGAGKTILLKQLALNLPDSLYLSADTIQEGQLFETVKLASEKLNIKTILIDEIHFQKNFDAILKRIFDFLDVRIFFTSSVSLKLYESAYDLSRRVEIIPIGTFTLREYIRFKHNIELPSLTIDDIIERRWATDHARFEFEFESYIKGGLMPFSLNEPDILTLSRNILTTVISRDIPSVQRVHVDELRTIEKVVAFAGKSAAEDINPSVIANNLGVTRYMAERYIKWLEQAFILNPVLPAGTNLRKEPKILMRLPYRLLYSDYESAKGFLREDFFAEMMFNCSIPYEYLKSNRGEKTPDFLVQYSNESIVIEIGGRSKGRDQFKNFTEKTKKLILAHGDNIKENQRPLFMLGYL